MLLSSTAQVAWTGDDMSIAHPLMFLVPRRHKTLQPTSEGPLQNTVPPQKTLIKMPMYEMYKRKKNCHTSIITIILVERKQLVIGNYLQTPV